MLCWLGTSQPAQPAPILLLHLGLLAWATQPPALLQGTAQGWAFRESITKVGEDL